MPNIIELVKKRYLRKTVKYIIWDFDGTLYQSQRLGRDLRLVFLKLAKKNNKFVSPNVFDSYTKKCGSWSAAASKLTSLPETEILDMADTKINKLKYIKTNLSLVSAIESTQDRYHHLILTNSTSKEVVSSLKKIGFDTSSSNTGPFKKIFSRDTTGFLKPNPKIYDQILAYTKTIKSRHLFIGDSLVHDIHLPKKLGFKCLPIWHVDSFFQM